MDQRFRAILAEVCASREAPPLEGVHVALRPWFARHTIRAWLGNAISTKDLSEYRIGEASVCKLCKGSVERVRVQRVRINLHSVEAQAFAASQLCALRVFICQC
eukprot:3166821-Amphidinium_carterae.1